MAREGKEFWVLAVKEKNLLKIYGSQIVLYEREVAMEEEG